jgi:hypothetical protein
VKFFVGLVLFVVAWAGPLAQPTVQGFRPPSDESMRCPMFEPLFRAYGLPVRQFSFLAWRESKCQIKAVGWNYVSGMSRGDCRSGKLHSHRKCEAVKSYDLGLLQINSSWVTVTKGLCGRRLDKKFDMDVLLELSCNLRVAKHLYDRGGYKHWGF